MQINAFVITASTASAIIMTALSRVVRAITWPSYSCGELAIIAPLCVFIYLIIGRRHRAALFTVPATVIGQYSSDDVTAREGDTVVLTCNVTGIPEPEVTWYRRHRTATHAAVSRRRT